MRARFAYPLLFLLPAAMASFLAGFIAAAGGAGILWIFVFGDNQWPAFAELLLMSLAVLVALGIFFSLLSAAYTTGKKREPGGLARRHLAMAVAITVLLPLLVFFQQWQVGNFGH